MNEIMPFHVDFDEDAHILTVRYRGTVDAASLRQGASEGAHAAARHECTKIIIDCREAESRLSTLEIYELPTVFAAIISELGLEIRRFRRALVVSEDSRGDYRFAETTAVNRGQEVRLFADDAAAKAWLSAMG